MTADLQHMPLLLADAAYQAGTVIGALIWVLIIVAVVRAVMRRVRN